MNGCPKNCERYCVAAVADRWNLKVSIFIRDIGELIIDTNLDTGNGDFTKCECSTRRFSGGIELDRCLVSVRDFRSFSGIAIQIGRGEFGGGKPGRWIEIVRRRR